MISVKKKINVFEWKKINVSEIFLLQEIIALADLAPLPPYKVFIFMQFFAKIMPNNKLAPPLGLDPPLGNPGSSTEFYIVIYY